MLSKIFDISLSSLYPRKCLTKSIAGSATRIARLMKIHFCGFPLILVTVACLCCSTSRSKAAVLYTDQHRFVSVALTQPSSPDGQDTDENFAVGSWDGLAAARVSDGIANATQSSKIVPNNVHMSGVLSVNILSGVTADAVSDIRVNFTVDTPTPFKQTSTSFFPINGDVSQVGGGLSYPFSTSVEGLLPAGNFVLHAYYEWAIGPTPKNEFHAFVFDFSFVPEPSTTTLASTVLIPLVVRRKR
jgi:hypothetical protein